MPDAEALIQLNFASYQIEDTERNNHPATTFQLPSFQTKHLLATTAWNVIDKYNIQESIKMYHRNVCISHVICYCLSQSIKIH